jgi:hypothetical protein
MPASEIPAPGLYEARLVKGGPLVAVAVWWRCPFVYPDPEIDPDDWFSTLDRSPRLLAAVDGRWRDPLWVATLRDLKAVDIARFLWLAVDRAWAQQWAPGTPEAQPWQAVDVAAIPSII